MVAAMQSPTRSSRLPASRAFVVHLLDEADPALGRYPGRVEHVTSGETRRFDNVATLLAFFGEMFDRDAGDGRHEFGECDGHSGRDGSTATDNPNPQENSK